MKQYILSRTRYDIVYISIYKYILCMKSNANTQKIFRPNCIMRDRLTTLYSIVYTHTYQFIQTCANIYHLLKSHAVYLACTVYVVTCTLHKTVCTLTYCHVLSFSQGISLPIYKPVQISMSAFIPRQPGGQLSKDTGSY